MNKNENKKGNIFIKIGLALIATAVILTCYNFYDDFRAGRSLNDVLGRLLGHIDDNPIPEEGRLSSDDEFSEIEYPDYILNPNMDMPVEVVDGVEYIGVLSIPAIDREYPVISDWDYDKLRISACRYSGTAYLNNMVICGHNYSTHFGPIRDLNYGDFVYFTDMSGNKFTYQVVEIETLKPTALDELLSGDWKLTLLTCTTGATARVVIRCDLVTQN